MSIQKSVLIVEDNADLSHLFSRSLRNHGWKTICAANPEEAMVALLRNSEVDVIVSDVEMPGSTGLELFYALKNIGSKIPFVLISARGNLERKELRRTGIFDFIQKPFAQDHLAQVLESALTSPAEELKIAG